MLSAPPHTKEPHLPACFLRSLSFLPSLSLYLCIHFLQFPISPSHTHSSSSQNALRSCCRSQTITATINHIATSGCAIQSQACIWMKTQPGLYINTAKLLCVLKHVCCIFIQGHAEVYKCLSSSLYRQIWQVMTE